MNREEVLLDLLLDPALALLDFDWAELALALRLRFVEKVPRLELDRGRDLLLACFALAGDLDFDFDFSRDSNVTRLGVADLPRIRLDFNILSIFATSEVRLFISKKGIPFLRV